MQNFGVYPIRNQVSDVLPYKDNCMRSLERRPWKQIRIDIDTRLLVSDISNTTLAADLINNVFTPVVEYLTSTLKVRRRVQRIRLNDICKPSARGKCPGLEAGSFCGDVRPPSLNSDADVVVVFTAKDEPSPLIRASSLSCATDECDRPIFGRINLSPLELLGYDAANINRLRAIILHEFTHILVFDLAHMPRYRFSNGRPRVAREADGLPPRIYYDARYVGNVLKISNFGVSTPQPFSIESTNGVVQHFNERGMSCDCPGKSNESWEKCLRNTTHGPCVGKIITAKVKEKVREYFNCPTLNGAELDNEDPDPLFVFNSHWSERILGDDLMNGFVPSEGEELPQLSNITLALYEDSGWYQVNYSNALQAEKGVTRGYLAGCEFAMGDGAIHILPRVTMLPVIDLIALARTIWSFFKS